MLSSSAIIVAILAFISSDKINTKNKMDYNLNGWRLVDINNNVTILKIENLIKNLIIEKNFFLIPDEN